MIKLMLSVDDIVDIDDYVCMLMRYWSHVFPLVFVDHIPIKGPMAQWLWQDELATLEDSMLVADALRHVPWLPNIGKITMSNR